MAAIRPLVRRPPFHGLAFRGSQLFMPLDEHSRLLLLFDLLFLVEIAQETLC